MTTSAVSQRIRQLEADLKCALFHRGPRGVVLSDEGRAFLPHAERTIETLRAGLTVFDDLAMPRALRMVALSSFSAKWLAPRLPRFSMAHPNIEIALFHDHLAPNFEAGRFDMALLWGRGHWPGCDAEILLREKIFPICQSSYAARFAGRRLAQAAAETILLSTAIMSEWPEWLAGADCRLDDFSRVHAFDDGALMIDAARRGQGLAIARSCLAHSALVRGELVVPFSQVLQSDNAYYIVTPKLRAPSPAVSLFVEWIKGEARAYSHDEQAYLGQLDGVER